MAGVARRSPNQSGRKRNSGVARSLVFGDFRSCHSSTVDNGWHLDKRFLAINHKLTIIALRGIVALVNPKKEPVEKSKNAGISIEPWLKMQMTELSERLGFKSLSGYTHFLFLKALEDEAQKMEEAGRKNLRGAAEKLRRAFRK
jgi:hypothetical protein